MTTQRLTIQEEQDEDYWCPGVHYNLVGADGVVAFSIEDKATAEKIARAWNEHDELMELARWIVDEPEAPSYLRRKARLALAKIRWEA